MLGVREAKHAGTVAAGFALAGIVVDRVVPGGGIGSGAGRVFFEAGYERLGVWLSRHFVDGIAAAFLVAGALTLCWQAVFIVRNSRVAIEHGVRPMRSYTLLNADGPETERDALTYALLGFLEAGLFVFLGWFVVTS